MERAVPSTLLLLQYLQAEKNIPQMIEMRSGKSNLHAIMKI
jgi:hypothetical protein